MSYYQETGGLGDLDGLGSLDAGHTFPMGAQLVAGYLVASSASAAEKLAALNAAMAYGFRGTIVRSGWGGPGAPGGVPAGSMWIIVQIARSSGVTGAEMNTIFSNVGQRLQSQLPAGSRVTNTHASPYGSSGGSSSTPDIASLLASITGGAATTPTTPTGIDPATGLPYGSMLPPAETGFFSQTIGGIPMWGVLAGGTLALGTVAYVLMSKPKSTPNRRRRGRRSR
jgi:hypothetical protein